MSQSSKSGLEFKGGAQGVATPKVTPGRRKKEGVRRFYRLPFAAAEKVTVEMNGRAYDVVDISRDGIGLLIAGETPFPAAGEKVNLIVSLGGASHSLSGKVIHISPDFSDQYLCGIQFVGIKKKFQEEMDALLKTSRDYWFSSGQD